MSDVQNMFCTENLKKKKDKNENCVCGLFKNK